MFLKYLARLFRAALISSASVNNLECNKRVGRQHSLLCVNVMVSCNEFRHA